MGKERIEVSERKDVLPLVFPIALLAFATVLVRAFDVDRLVAGQFFGGNGHWPMLHAEPFRFIYDYGAYPGVVLFYVAVAIWLTGLVYDHGIARRAFYCAMVVLIGPGLIVNGLLKPHTSRPRPCQTTEFDGSETFQPVLSIAAANDGVVCKSFPSGHASMGFALIAPAFLLRRRRRLYCLALGFAIGFGCVVGIARIVQGRHFASDILWSGAIVYLTAVLLYYVIGIHREKRLTLRTRNYDLAGRLISIPLPQSSGPTAGTVTAAAADGVAAAHQVASTSNRNAA